MSKKVVEAVKEMEAVKQMEVLKEVPEQFKEAEKIWKLSEVDRLSLEVAKANRRAALAQAKQAMSENEASELSYKYFILQLYMKYGLSESDAINEQGEILKGHVTKQ